MLHFHFREHEFDPLVREFPTYCMVQPKRKESFYLGFLFPHIQSSRTKLVVFRPFCGKL